MLSSLALTYTRLGLHLQDKAWIYNKYQEGAGFLPFCLQKKVGALPPARGGIPPAARREIKIISLSFFTLNDQAMENINLTFDDKGYGKFSISEGGEQIAEMVISIAGDEMTVYHTEVDPKGEGQGLAKKLLAAMVDHARKNNLKVKPLCAFVHAQFRRHPDEYADLWHS